METFKIQKSALIKRISAIEDKEILESLITILDHYQADFTILQPSEKLGSGTLN